MSEASVLNAIFDLLNQHQFEFREVHHEPTYTSEDSACARGESLQIGGKALLIKADGDFHLFVLPADRKVDSGSIRKKLATRKTRFANREELEELTGLVPGSVPPFGRPILPFDLYVDSAIRDNERIAFNAGSLTDSIIMAVDDYLNVAQPVEVFSFSV